ncbi:hypothetical protein ACU610_22810 [Geodermatophilus sp. URMC 61]
MSGPPDEVRRAAADLVAALGRSDLDRDLGPVHPSPAPPVAG